MSRLLLTLDGKDFAFEVLEGADEAAAGMAGADATPLELVHSMWSGPACVAALPADRSTPAPFPVTSLYPGWLALRADGGQETGGAPALVISYGEAELRDARGSVYGWPLARLAAQDVDALSAQLEAIRLHGRAPATISYVA